MANDTTSSRLWNWLHFVGAGFLVGGSVGAVQGLKQGRAEAHTYLESHAQLPEAQRPALTRIVTQRYIYACMVIGMGRGIILRGSKYAFLAGTFYGVKIGLTYLRHERQLWPKFDAGERVLDNTIGGAVAGALLSAILVRGFRGLLVGGAFGAFAGAVFGLCEEVLENIKKQQQIDIPFQRTQQVAVSPAPPPKTERKFRLEDLVREFEVEMSDNQELEKTAEAVKVFRALRDSQDSAASSTIHDKPLGTTPR